MPCCARCTTRFMPRASSRQHRRARRRCNWRAKRCWSRRVGIDSKGFRDMAQWIANMILLAALVAAIWYAWETRTMRLDMIRPKVLFLTRQHQPETLDDMTSVDLFVRNVGNGTAMNISVEHLWDKSLELRTDPEH